MCNFFNLYIPNKALQFTSSGSSHTTDVGTLDTQSRKALLLFVDMWLHQIDPLISSSLILACDNESSSEKQSIAQFVSFIYAAIKTK